jgi:hypothetical protein
MVNGGQAADGLSKRAAKRRGRPKYGLLRGETIAGAAISRY